MDIAQFRKDFPEFADTVRYPSSQITFWSGLAELQLNEDVFQDIYTHVVKLYTAHEITLAAQSAKAAAFGGVPGQQTGVLNSKTVGSVTASYDTGESISEKGAGHWNLTSYGKQLWRLMMMYGAGSVQLS